MTPAKNTSKGPTPKRGTVRHQRTGGLRTTQRAALLHRYTAPIPKDARRSAPWYPYFVLSLAVLGILTIVLNYMDILPGGVTNWWLLIGIGLLGASFWSSIRWR